MKSLLKEIKWNTLDRNKIERNHPPRAIGKQMGEKNLPSSSEISLSNYESEIHASMH